MAWPRWLSDDPERREFARQLGLSRRTHGHSGVLKSPTYNSWRAMKQRCDNPNDRCFRYYGSRGIGYDSRWSEFDAFLADMGERPEGMTLDRIDNDLDYSRANCRWADAKTQSVNRRPRATVRGGQ